MDSKLWYISCKLLPSGPVSVLPSPRIIPCTSQQKHSTKLYDLLVTNRYSKRYNVDMQTLKPARTVVLVLKGV